MKLWRNRKQVEDTTSEDPIWAGLRVMHQMRGGLWTTVIDRCRCEAHFQELVDKAFDAGAFRSALMADDFWPHATRKDAKSQPEKLVCEVCSGKWKPWNLSGFPERKTDEVA